MKRPGIFFKAKIVGVTMHYFIEIATGYNHTTLMVLFVKMHTQYFFNIRITRKCI